MSTEISTTRQVQVTTVEDNGIVVLHKGTGVELGEPRDISVLTFIRNTYPASYNHVVRNMNSLNYQTNTPNKRSMRGGHLLLYRYVVLFSLLLSFAFGIASIYVKPCAAVPFFLTVLYLAISIYNIVVYVRNRPLINQIVTRQIQRGLLDGHINRFFMVPINATTLTGIIAAYIDPAVIIAAVRRENVQITEIEVMLYDDRYLQLSRFPKEIVIHIIIFFIMFILAIAFVNTTAR